MDNFFKRTWSEVDLDKIRNNFDCIREKVGDRTKIMSVVKANAYGHGITYVARELVNAGTDWFAVSNLEEALQLRKICEDVPILILGYTPPKYAAILALNSISQTVFDADYAKALSEYASEENVEVNIHVKIDTGMSRIGFVYHDNVINAESVDVIEKICTLPALYKEGIFMHFASADEDGSGEVFTRLQYDLFLDMISRLEKRGIKFDLHHCCNSAATLRFPEMHMDMVRPRIILYGLEPSEFVPDTEKLLPAMELKTVVSMVKELEEGTPISYGRTYTTEGKMKIATIPIGYADGLPRSLSNDAEVLVNGQRAKLVGRICMDQSMIDVTNINVKPDDEVIIFGNDSDESITVTSLAKKTGTINYEIVCDINKRVPRAYLKNGEIIATENYTL